MSLSNQRRPRDVAPDQRLPPVVLRELSGGACLLPELGSSDIAKAADVIERYRDQDISTADASIVVLAERYATRQLLTLDRRHFGVLRPAQGGRFTLLP